MRFPGPPEPFPRRW